MKCLKSAIAFPSSSIPFLLQTSSSFDSQLRKLRRKIPLHFVIMAHFISLISFLLVALLINQSTQHFLLNYPATIGFDDSVEGTAPCGSFTVDFSKDNVTDFHVGGDAIALMSVHPEATWLFRATLDQTASGNWTTLAPPVLQMGLGDFCEQNVKVPSSFTGSKGVIQVIQDAPDGILYQVRPRYLPFIRAFGLSFPLYQLANHAPPIVCCSEFRRRYHCASQSLYKRHRSHSSIHFRSSSFKHSRHRVCYFGLPYDNINVNCGSFWYEQW